jgi:hypothetical protein
MASFAHFPGGISITPTLTGISAAFPYSVMLSLQIRRLIDHKTKVFIHHKVHAAGTVPALLGAAD